MSSHSGVPVMSAMGQKPTLVTTPFSALLPKADTPWTSERFRQDPAVFLSQRIPSCGSQIGYSGTDLRRIDSSGHEIARSKCSLARLSDEKIHGAVYGFWA